MTTQANILQSHSVTLDDLRRFATSAQLYTILDPCDAPAVLGKVRELGDDRAASLYRGSAEEEYWAVAPYLARVDDELFDWIVATLLKEPWGIFVIAESNLEDLRKHFRRFHLVELPDGKSWFFRYYDPRVIEVYITSSLVGELQEFFGPVRAFATASLESCLLFPSPNRKALQPQFARATQSPLWKIRLKQIEAFEALARRNFQDRMIVHLRDFFPDKCAAAEREKMRKIIDYGVKRAASHGITIERDVCKYIDLMFVYGLDFDQDPLCEWASNTLNDRQLKDSGDMAAQLFEAGATLLKDVESQEADES